jgi:hypothetical protein
MGGGKKLLPGDFNATLYSRQSFHITWSHGTPNWALIVSAMGKSPALDVYPTGRYSASGLKTPRPDEAEIAS